MRAVVTRVTEASVSIAGETAGRIGRGLLVLLGVGPADTGDTAARMARKICTLRVFEDEGGRMNRDLAAVGGGLLVVSQFTLYADTRSRRPGRSWPSRCMSGFWRSAACRASRRSGAGSARTCRWPR